MKTFLLAFTFLLSLPAFAQSCGFSFSGGNITAIMKDTQEVLQQNITLSRTNNAGNCAAYRLYFTQGQANSYAPRKAFSGAKSVSYNLHPTINLSGIIKNLNDATSSAEWVQGALPARNTNYSNTYFFSLPDTNAQNFPEAGIYQDTVQAIVYSVKTNGTINQLELSTNVTIMITVTKKVDVALVSEGGTFDANATSMTMDFGLLQQNQELGADLMVSSNTPYELKVSSLNNGVLKGSSQSVSYQLTVGGVPVGLSSSSSSPVSIGSGTATGSSGRRSNLRVKITEDTSTKPAGLYQDALTITAIAN